MALVLILAACGDDYDGPGGVAGGGGGALPQQFVGAWEYTRILAIGDDIEVSTTTWFFDAELTCRRRVVTELGSEGIPRETDRTCTWRVEGTDLVVTWIDDQSVERFPYEFPGTDGNELVLTGLTFTRVT